MARKDRGTEQQKPHDEFVDQAARQAEDFAAVAVEEVPEEARADTDRVLSTEEAAKEWDAITKPTKKINVPLPEPEAPPLLPFRVSLGSNGPTTPDPRKPEDPPIMALDDKAAVKQFFSRHGILSSEHTPEVTQLGDAIS